MSGVLRLGPFRRLLAAYALNELCWSLSSLALSLLVYRRTGSALGSTAFFMCAQFVPALISPITVGRLDHLHSRLVLPVLYGVEALLYLILAETAGRLPVPVVLTIATVDGILALTARSLARAATVAVTSKAGLLREGNALANSLFSVCFLAGPALGGVLVVAGGTSAALLVIAALFVVITITLVTASDLPAPEASPSAAPRRGRVRAALAHANAQPMVRSLLSLKAVLLLFFTMSIPVEVVYAEHTLHAGAAGYGILLSAWGGGAVAGSMIYARWRTRHMRTLIVLGTGLLAFGLLVMAAAPTIALGVVGSAIAGTGNGVEAVAVRTALQEQIDSQWMALMMSFNESLAQSVPGLGILLGGAIATAVSSRAALGVGGIGGALAAAAAWVLLAPAVFRTPKPHIERAAPDGAGRAH